MKDFGKFTRRATAFYVATAAFALLSYPVASEPLADAPDPSSAPMEIVVGYWGAFTIDVSYDDVQVAVELWSNQLTMDWNRPVHPVVRSYDDMDELLASLRAGTVDVITLDPLSYLRLEEKIPLVPALLTVTGERLSGFNGVQHRHSLVVRESAVRDLEDLRGGRLSLEPRRAESTASEVWLETVLLRSGHALTAEFLGSQVEHRNAAAAILSVFFGQAQACLVRRSSYQTMLEFNPQVGEQTRELLVSQPYINGVTCFPPNIDPENHLMLLEGDSARIRRRRGTRS